MSFTHDDYVLAILELNTEFSPSFTAVQYLDAILRLARPTERLESFGQEAEFVLIPVQYA